MTRSAFRYHAALVGIAGALLASSAPSAAQEETDFPMVTALSSEQMALTLSSADGEPQRIGMGWKFRAEDEDRLTVARGQSAMIYSPSGEVVLLVLGPAKLGVRVMADRIAVALYAGRLMTTSLTTQGQVVHLLAPTAQAAPLFEGLVGPGWTMLLRDESIAHVAYVAEADGAESLSISALGNPTQVPSGQRLVIREGTAELAGTEAQDLELWLRDRQFDRHGLGRWLGMRSAVINRRTVQKGLVTDLIYWDTGIRVEEVVFELAKNPRVDPEVRQVVSTTVQVQTTANRGGTPSTPGAAGANEVPLLSPAAISVGGVTAISLNSSARGLLTNTNSRGLGFNGLSQLALPGFRNGIRNVGPAGLAARRP